MAASRLFSPEMFDTLEVEVDFWENQRYKPLGGWAPPYLGTFPNYSNLLGDHTIDFDKLDQLPCLPEGWSWVESKWEVDVPESRRHEIKSYPIRGETDPDGWSYAGSMETLIKSAQDRLLLSERSAMNTARRRRWRRTRRCMQNTAKKIENYRRDYVKKTCRSIDAAIDQSTKLATTMQDFHYKWRRSVDNVLRINDKLNKDTAAQLVFVRSKLTLLKECLTDIGQIEAAYSAKLRHFSSKWMNAGQKDFSRMVTHKEEDTITRRLSLTLLGASASAHHVHPEDGGSDEEDASAANGMDGTAATVKVPANGSESEEGPEDKGFFRAIARANEEIADHKSVFASSLNSLLPADIDRIVSDLEDLIEDHLGETTHTRSQLLTLREVAEETLSACVSAAFAATRRLSIERSVLMDSLSVISASWDARIDLVPALMNEELVDVNNIFPSLDAIAAVDGSNGSSHSSAASSQYAPATGSAAQDSWFLLLRYGQTLVQANASMLLLHAQSKVYQRKMTQQCTVVSDLLMSLVKLFAHEHFRCYSEAQSILLDAIGAINGLPGGTGSGNAKASSTEGDAEHDLQQLHSQQLAQATVAATGAVTGTLKVSQSHVDAIRQKHLQALPATSASSEAQMSHQGLNEEELAAHLATALAPAPTNTQERRILGAPTKRQAATTSNTNDTVHSKKGPVEMPPLATILPFISLYRTKIICMSEVRFLCLAPTSLSSSSSSNTAGNALSLSSNSLASAVPQWRWQRGALVLTQDMCLHILDLGLPSKSSTAEEETELTMDDFYKAVESGLDSFRVYVTCSVARSVVVPLLLTTDERYANTFQIRLHPAYQSMTLTTHSLGMASSSGGGMDHDASTGGAATTTSSAAASASSFFSSMFASSTLSSLTSSGSSSSSNTMASSTSHSLSSTSSAAQSHNAAETLVNLSSMANVFAGSSTASTALSTSVSSSSSASSHLANTIANVESIHVAGRYASVHCEPRAANTYHASVNQIANVCALLIAPLSAANAAMLLKKLSAPFCEINAKSPESFANDVLANSSATVAGDAATTTAGQSALEPSGALHAAVSSTSSMSSSTLNDELSIGSFNPMMGLSSSSSNAPSSAVGSESGISGSNGISSSSTSSVPMMTNPLMKNPLKRTSSAIMKKQQLNNTAQVQNTANAATIPEEK